MLEVTIEKTTGSFTLQSSFTAGKGALAILGSSGCGKSMTLKCIAGLYTPDKGCIKLNDSILYSSEQKICVPPRKRNIGFVFQNYALFPHLTVEHNIAYGIRHYEKRERRQKVADMIKRMQLTGLENQFPSQLSGGQQQRTALGRTLITEPGLLLLDEPLSALDSHIKYLLEKELISIIKENFDGIILLVTHNIEEAYRICDNIMVIDNGRNMQAGAKDELIHNPINMSAARITGCKNFLDVTVTGEDQDYYFLKSKNLDFKALKTNIEASVRMTAGIRAHYLKLSPVGVCLENSYICEIQEIIEGVFSTTVVVSCQGCEFRAEVEKAVAPDIARSQSKEMLLQIPPENVFLMNY